MRAHRLLIALAGLGAALVFAAPASAQDYPPTTGNGTVSSGTVAQGGSVTLSGGGFAAGATVSLTAFCDGTSYSLGTATANEGGNISASVTAPAACGTGPVVFNAVGLNGNGTLNTVTAAVTVAGAATGTTGATTGTNGLAVTGLGTHVTPAAISGAGAVLVGAGLVWFAMRSRRRQGSHAS